TVMELSASLADTNTGAVLLPFNLNFRGRGALTVPDAENFALREAGDRILSEYAARLSEYLARLTPRL
ncbi:MAG: hypothetical protein FWE09_05035, partial [Treponema sp.]|nr:hypothetical protein [Treponema sp.]